MSELKILDEFMQRVQYDVGEPLRPCDYFHSITGVGASGVVAILLGVLGRTIEETSGAFLQLCKQVFPTEEITAEARSAKLEDGTRQLLREFGLPENCRLRGDLHGTSECKVSIAYMAAMDMTNCRMLRNYESHHSSYNPTIIEAIRIAWATPGLFAPIRVGTQILQEDLVSAVDGFNNPTFQAVKEAYEIFGSDERMACLLSIGAGKPMVRSLSIDRQDLLQRGLRDTEMTVEQMRRRYGSLQVYFRLSVDRDLEFDRPSFTVDKRTERIMSHTSTYLETHDAFSTMDHCVKSSRQASRVTIDHLYHTRTGNSRSSHGLPPLSTFFVVRHQPMDDIIKSLQNTSSDGQRVAVVVGMGGSGKTQVALKYGYECDDLYDHILFVDASSPESLQTGLHARVRKLDPLLNPKTPVEALQLLAHPEGNISRNWLIIMDNADNSNIDIRKFFPDCDHGAILITSRNPTLGNLSQDGPILLDVMSREEAVELLLATALGLSSHRTNSDRLSKGVVSVPRQSERDKASTMSGPPVRITDEDRRHAGDIVALLGFLPVAIVQAGCYIRMQKCLPEYAARLQANRSTLLRKPAQAQRDRLKYDHSVYAAFDATLSALSSSALQLLGILSFVHFADFPRPLFVVAASYGFAYEPQYLLERGEDFQASIDLLKSIFCPDGKWDETALDQILEELQQYSMVTLVPVYSTVTYSTVTLRFHPLLHAWAKDRLSETEATAFRAAAVRLLSCGTNYDDEYLWEYLLPHFKYISPFDGDLHVNDRGALAAVVGQHMSSHELVRIWEDLYSRVKQIYGETHVQTSQAALELADAYGQDGDREKMEEMEREVVRVRTALLGEEHPSTLRAIGNLARTLRGNEDYDAAAELEVKVLDSIRKLNTGDHRALVQALTDLAWTRTGQGLDEPAITLLHEALEAVIALKGKAHPLTIRVMEQLSNCYANREDTDQVEQLGKEIHTLQKQFHGDRHTKTFDAVAFLASAYSKQAKYADAEAHWREVLEGRRETLGDSHLSTLHAMHQLGVAIFGQEHYMEAKAVWEEEVQIRTEVNGPTDEQTLEAIFWVARCLYGQEQYGEAESLWRQELSERRKIHGNLHRDTFDSLRWLGHAVDAQGNYEEAIEIWQEEVAGRQILMGNEDVSTLESLGNLAAALFDLDEYTEAENLRRVQWDGSQRQLGEFHSETLQALYCLARCLYEQGRYSEAQDLWMEEIAKRRTIDDQPNEDVYNAQYWVARSLFEQELYEEAEEVFGETLAGRRELCGEREPDTVDTIHWLARAMYAQCRYEESEELWRQALPISQEVCGEQDETTLNIIEWLSNTLFEQEEYDECEELRRELLESRRETFGQLESNTMAAMFQLAQVLFELEKYGEAEQVSREELQCRREVHGDHHKDTHDAMHWLGRALYDQGKYEESRRLWEEEVEGRKALDGPEDPVTLQAIEWLAKIDAKQQEDPIIDRPSASSDSRSATPDASIPPQLQPDPDASQELVSPVPSSASPRTPQSFATSQLSSPNSSTRATFPWLQRIQQSGKKRLDRISRILP
ncbi:hypothetical protein M408DRAFT_141107 [Serendipita vermifera MAFF 305830]|uniref:PNPLA domain-containing protein n=1 Tax=Serendipita vermifera MAFF 305830 TaxID=933852 RepID=A0A0C3AV42_SERVB|nr:hypothetical protein M408DRAFT_141107 [Serendipita vermifera MAFF 305830]